ncbi:MAG TPA: hypothetical protein VK858_06100 [Longimicrobiales bacterium]|nr:hypothetical protein [Longimicrobiales bacterium]
MLRSSLSSTPRSRTAFVGLLLVGALALSGVLAWQVVDAGRSHEAVAHTAVKEQALFAAWEFGNNARRLIWDKLTRPGLDVVAGLGGKNADGYRTNMSVEPWWRLSRHLTIGGMLSLHRLWFPDRDQTVNADQIRLRVSAALDTHLSAEAFVQYSAAARVVSTNPRIRYRFGEGRDLFLVLDEGRDLEARYGLESAVLGRTDRRLLIKYSYAFRP